MMTTLQHKLRLPVVGLTAIGLTMIVPAITQTASGEPVQGPASGDFLSADPDAGSSAARFFSREETKEGEKEAVWFGQAHAGLSVSTGNAENNNITAGINAKYIKRPWRHTIAADIYFAENEGKKTAEYYSLSHKLDYKLNDKTYIFNFLSYDADEFAEIDSRIADVVGLGRLLISTDKHSLEAELGLGYRQTKFTTNIEDEKETVGHLGLIYFGKLTDTTTLSENLMVQGGSDNIFTESTTALSVEMTERLSLSLNYTIRNNNDTPAGIEKTDTVTSVNIVASF